MRSIVLTVVVLAVAAGAFWVFGRGTREVPTGTELERSDVSAPVEPIGAAPREAAATSSRPAEPETARLTIRGLVVDSDGRGVAGVRVLAEAQPTPQEPLRGWPPQCYGEAVSAADGAFEVRADPRGRGVARFQLASRQNPGYGDAELPDQTWGLTNARLVLPLGSTLEVTVVDEATGEPVDPVSVRLGWPSDTEQFRMRAEPAIVARPRPGVVVFGQVRVTRAMVFVVPKDSLHARVSYDVGPLDGGRRQVTVPVPRERHRGLRVLGADGAPIAKAMFQLVRDYAPESRSLHIGDFDDVMRGGTPRLRVQGGFVDERGESVLYGAPGIRYDLVVEAPGRASQVFHDLFVSDGMTPFVAVLAPGAAIFGKLGPPEAMEAMWRTDAEIARGNVFRPALWLETMDSRLTGIEVAQRAQLPLRRDGTFELEGLAAGSYRVNLYWFDANAKPHSELLGEVRELAATERRRVEFTFDRVVPGRVTVTVHLDGAPFANGRVDLEGTARNGVGAVIGLGTVRMRTDAEGRFALNLPRGAWRAVLTVPFVPVGGILVPSLDVVEVLPATTEVRFEAVRIRAIVTVLDEKGQPVADLPMETRTRWTSRNVRTDAQGVVIVEAASPGKLGFVRKDSASGSSSNVVELGSIDIARSPATQSFELRLPH